MHNSFNLLEQKNLPDFDSVGYLLEHKKTKAQVLYLKNSDENKAFAISFKTIPGNSTGVAHILEHSVLCGSKKYPTKDPFKFLIKSSMATFINAITYPDMTVYPLATTNEKDLLNLGSVYLDAVFDPIISEEVFMQEGWHYELFNKDEPITYKGVVFNEMKGAYATVDDVMQTKLYNWLYKNSVFGVDSGGDPAQIPNLTYTEFKEFYAENYHPSNSQTLLYGDLDPIPFLNLLDDYFSRFEAKPTSVTSVDTPKFDGINEVTEKFAVSTEGETKSIYVLGWLFSTKNTIEDYFAMEVLEYLLVRSESSELKKALLDSELAESFYDYGYDPHTYFSIFALGMKDVIDADAHVKIQELIESKLKEYATSIDKKALEGALNRVEFTYRTNVGSYNNMGLRNFTLVNKFWKYGENPLDVLNFLTIFDKLREEGLNGTYFENLIKIKLIENSNKISFSFFPDEKLIETQNSEEVQKLSDYKNTLSDAQLDNLVKVNTNLKELQESVESPEVVSKLPALKLSDIPSVARQYPITVLPNSYQTTHVAVSEPTVIEGQLCFSIAHLEQDLVPYLDLYAEALLRVGTKKYPSTEFATMLDVIFGEVSSSIVTGTSVQTNETYKYHVVSFKILEKNLADAFLLMSDFIFEPNFMNGQKIKELIAENKVFYESELIQDGHVSIGYFGLASFNEANWINDATKGITGYKLYKKLNSGELSVDEVIKKLLYIHSKLVTKTAFSVNIGCNQGLLSGTIAKVNEFYTNLPEGHKTEVVKYKLLDLDATGFLVPSKVNYVGLYYSLTNSRYDALKWFLGNMVKADYLWDEVRVKGGAYGAMFDMSHNGLMGFSSYRDPNIERTYQVYERLGEFLKTVDYSEDDMEQLKIGTLRRFEPFYNQDRVVKASWLEYLRGFSSDYRQKTKDQILGLTLEIIHDFGDSILDLSPFPSKKVVLGNKEAIETYGKLDKVETLF